MRRRLAALALSTLLAGPAFAESDTDALRMLDQAMIMRSAATRCAEPSSVRSAAFRRAYLQVAAQAQAALKSLASDLTQAHIQSVMADHYDEIDRHVIAIIEQESCGGADILEALRKYDSLVNSAPSQQIANKVD